MNSKQERLQRLGDRLDWLYPPERDEALSEILTPLFRERKQRDDQATTDPQVCGGQGG